MIRKKDGGGEKGGLMAYNAAHQQGETEMFDCTVWRFSDIH